MGRGPSSHPPGALSLALPHRAIMGPRKMTDERISRISTSGTSHLSMVVESTVIVWPSRSTLHPRCRRILMAESTSRRSGQLCKTFLPALTRVAASIGSTLFFAPPMETAPASGLPPLTTSMLMLFSSRTDDTAGFAPRLSHAILCRMQARGDCTARFCYKMLLTAS